MFCTNMLLLFILFFLPQNVLSADKPNVIFIMADDYGWNDVSWHNSHMPTKNIADLAQGDGGVIFNNAYVNYLCSPSRSAFMTGNYPHLIGTQDGTFKSLEPTGIPLKFEFLPETLKTAGYQNYMVGKWHLGYCDVEYAPLKRGFDKFYGLYNGASDHFTHKLRPGSKETPALDLTDMETADWTKDDIYSTELFRDKAIEYLQGHKASNPSDPFFLYFSLQAVHTPLEVPEAYLAPCANFTDETRKTYCGMVQAMDQAIGKLVTELKTLGLYDDTIIIFSSDNGGQYGEGSNNYPLRGNKGSLWEGGTKAISFLHSPTYVVNSGTRDQLIHIVDWYPTIMNLAGIDTSSFSGSGIDQTAMALENDSTNERTEFVYNIARKGGTKWTSGGSAIRVNNYKMIAGSAGAGAGSWSPDDFCDPCEVTEIDEADRGVRIYDLDADPTETTNLADDDAYKGILRELRAKVVAYQAEEVASIHVDTSDPNGHPDNFNGAFSTGWCTAT